MSRQRFIMHGCQHTHIITILDVDEVPAVPVCQLHSRCCDFNAWEPLLRRGTEMCDMLNREQQVREVIAARPAAGQPATEVDAQLGRLEQQVLDLEDQLVQAKTRAECAERELRDILDCPANAPAPQAPTPPEVPAVPVAETFPTDDDGPLF